MNPPTSVHGLQNGITSSGQSPSAATRDDEPKPRRPTRRLTEQQLAKKRQNDREAQRAIRERTRTTIESLEHKVKQLETGQAYAEMQDVVRERDALKRENEELREKLGQVVHMLQPVTDQAPQLPPIRTRLGSTSLGTGEEYASDAADLDDHKSARCYTSPRAKPRDPSSFLASASPHDRAPISTSSDWNTSGQFGSRSEPPYSARALTSPTEALFRHYGTPQSVTSPPTASPHPSVTFSDTHRPQWLRVPGHTGSTSSFDTILLDLVHAARGRLAQGTSTVEELLGERYPEVGTFIDPDQDNYGGTHEISNVLCTMLIRGFSLIDGNAEKCGLVATGFPYFAWLIHPTQESYEAIPEHMRPTESQIQVPHPIWIDILQWPALRDELIRHAYTMSMDTLFLPYCRGLRTNWKSNATLSDCVYPFRRLATKLDSHRREADGYTTDFRINDDLLQHVRQLENWSVGSEFAQAFPWLASFVRVQS